MKQKPVIPRALAREDVDRAIPYYLEHEADKAALGLIDALGRAYRQLRRHPEIATHMAGYSGATMRGFRSVCL